MEMILVSFNDQEQSPDDILAQDRQWAPCLSVENSRHCSQEPARLTTKQDSPHLSRQQVSQVSTQELQFEHVMILPYQGVSRFEFQLYCRRIPFVRQGVVCSHSAVLQVSWTFAVIVFKEEQVPDDILDQYRQWAPCHSVENSRHCSQEPASLTTKQDSPHLSRHQVSQVSVPEFQFEHVMILPYQGVSRFEFQLYCRRIPFVNQGVVCSHSAVLQVSWTFAVIVFEDPRGSTLFVSMYISLAFSIRRFA
jgi:transposase-like protein